MEQVPISLPLVGDKGSPRQHPLGPLTSAEISESARLIKKLWPSDINLQFKAITLQEPNKADLAQFLAAEHAGLQVPSVERKSFVIYYIQNTVGVVNGHTVMPHHENSAKIQTGKAT
jgi:primary-amine oxidase